MAHQDEQRLWTDALEAYFQDLERGITTEQVQSQALGLGPDDLMAQISPISSPTTPSAPASVFVLGFRYEIGVAWQFARHVGNRTFAVEIQRATNLAMTDAVSLGEFQGFFMIDDNSTDKWGAEVTRYYQVRTIGRSGETIYSSGWTAALSGTTLAATATNTDLQARMDTFAAAVQGLHLYPLAVPSAALQSVFGEGSATSQEVSVNIGVETSNRISADNILSNAVSILSQQVSVISQKVSSVSVIAADVTGLRVGATPQTFRVYIDATSYLEFPVMVGSTAVIRQVGTGISAIFVGDYPTENAMLNLDALNRTIGFYTLGSRRWYINPSGHLLANDDNLFDIGQPVASALSASPRNLYLTGAVREGNWTASVISAQFLDTSALSVRVDTMSQAISVLSQQVSALSQSVSSQAAALSVRIDTQSQGISVISAALSVLSQAHSVLSNRVSANSALAGVNALVWLGV